MLNYHLALLMAAIFSRVLCAPKQSEHNDTLTNAYDWSRFNEVYDQRQNGSENYRLNVDGVAVVYAPAETLLAAAALLDPDLDDSMAELEEILKPQRPAKPEAAEKPVVSPERPSSSTTTSLPPKEAAGNVLLRRIDNGDSKHVRRRYGIPGLIRTFLGRRRDH